MNYLLEELLEVVKKHLGAFFRSYKVKTDLETAYSRIVAVRSFPYHEHVRGKAKETEVRTMDEALTFIEEKANTLEK